MKSIVRSGCLVLMASLAVPFTSSLPTLAQGSGAWRPLFNGKDLTGWTVPAGRGGRGGRSTAPALPADAPPAWKIENGVLIGGQPTPGMRNGALTTEQKFKDFELELDFLLAESGTRCSEELIGEKQENASADRTCLYNSGIAFRNGYQLNIGRREGGEYVGLVVHRVHPNAIRGNVLWLDHGDKKFPNLRKKEDWNTLRLLVQGDHFQAFMNGTKIVDVHDNPVLESEASWKEPGPISLQWPPAGESGGFAGFIKYRNVRVRTL